MATLPIKGILLNHNFTTSRYNENLKKSNYNDDVKNIFFA